MKNPQLYASVSLALSKLNDAELAAFRICLEWPDAQKVCETKPWFPMVKHLFTEESGQKMHEATMDAICTIVAKRLPL